MEAEMKRSHIAAFVAASAFGLAVPAWAVGPSQDTPNPTVSGQADQTKPGSRALSSDRSSDQSADQGQAKQTPPSKHPPTAVMDRATPPEKATKKSDAAGKHPPSRVMERATPEQKSPNSSGTQDSEGSSAGK
jgi:hypothetical protein